MPGYELIGKEEKVNIMKLFKAKSNFFRGPTVNAFQEAFKNKLWAGYAQAVTSCTAALKVAIEGLELPPKSEIITSSFTFVATAEAIYEAGHIPVFAEIDEGYNIDPEDVLRKITSNTRAIIPVHMYGAPANMELIKKIAAEHSLFIIEDVAQGLGSKFKGAFSGTIGDVGCFSFDAGKTVGCGDGGMIVTNSDVMWRRAYEYFDHGHQNNPAFPRGRDTRRKHGFNYRMTELQAAVGLAQLGKMDKIITAQKRNYEKIMKGLNNPIYDHRRFYYGAEHTYEAILLRLPTKDDVAVLYEILKKEGIITKNLPDAYDWHFAGTWAHMGVKPGSFPKTEDLLSRTVAIMVFVKMKPEQIKKIVRVLNDFHKNDEKPSLVEPSGIKKGALA